MEEKQPHKIEDKLFTIKYKTDNQTHLVPDMSKCLQCLDKICTIICHAELPANILTGNIQKAEKVSNSKTDKK